MFLFLVDEIHTCRINKRTSHDVSDGSRWNASIPTQELTSKRVPDGPTVQRNEKRPQKSNSRIKERFDFGNTPRELFFDSFDGVDNESWEMDTNRLSPWWNRLLLSIKTACSCRYHKRPIEPAVYDSMNNLGTWYYSTCRKGWEREQVLDRNKSKE